MILGNGHLEPYQDMSKDISKLNKYDWFYRVIGNPFYYLEIDEFMQELDQLILKIEEEYEA